MDDYNLNNLFGYCRDSFNRTYEFLNSQEICSTQDLPSRWRSTNTIVRVSCKYQDYVVKKMRETRGEIEKALLMRETYPDITPRIFLIEEEKDKECYTMDYVLGKSFFNLSREERVEKIRVAGKLLSEAYSQDNCETKDISVDVRKGFLRYRDKRKEYFDENELRLPESYFDIFRETPSKPSHNDLNAANLIYNGKIKLIDPSEEGYNDVARDVGRYSASCFFNNYDCFGNDKSHSIDIAAAFLENFDTPTLTRAKYYMGESFLSFLGFNTETVDKKVLKNLAINMLNREGDITKILEETIR